MDHKRINSTFSIQHSTCAKRGYVLIELLVAVILFAVAGSMLSMSFIQGLKTNKRIHEEFKSHDPLRVTFIQLERDLRNAVSLLDYPFHGKKDEIKFPGLLPEESKEGKVTTSLYLIHYYLKNKKLMRSQEKLTAKLVSEERKEKILIKELSSFEFQFPYQDDDSKEVFEPFWLDEPYFGVPRSTKIKITTPELQLEKLISIPQGKAGHLVHEK